MKQRLTEEPIIGILWKAKVGLSVNDDNHSGVNSDMRIVERDSWARGRGTAKDS